MSERRKLLVAEWMGNKKTMPVERLKELRLEIIQMIEDTKEGDVLGLVVLGALFIGQIEGQIQLLDHPKGGHWWNR